MTDLRWPTVLFDFDGTLGNTIPLILGSYRATIDHYGLNPASDEVIRSWIGRTLPDMFTELAGAERMPALVETYRAWQQEQEAALVEPYDGIDALVRDLVDAGAQVGVATSRHRASAERLMALLGLDQHVPLLVAMDDSAEHKPSPVPLVLAAERLGADPAQTVYVGDAVVDLQAAAAAGMAGIGVTWGAGQPDALRAEPSVAVVDTVGELRGVLLRDGQ